MGLSERTADYFERELNLDEDRKSIVLYSARVIYSTLLSLFAIIIVSSLTGVLSYALAAVATNALLRSFAGGAHASTPLKCSTIGTIVFTGIGLLTKYIPWPSNFLINIFIVTVGLIALIMVLRYAPADTPSRPLDEEIFNNKLKKRSLLVLFIWSIIAILFLTKIITIDYKLLVASTLGLLWESFTLTPLGYYLISLTD